MTASRITIDPMQAKYNPQVSRLLVHGFRGKFQHLTNLSDEDLALFFKKLARELEKQLSFYTHSQGNSIMRHLFFNEWKWHYMIMRLK